MSARSSDASGRTRVMDFSVHEHRQQASALMGACPRTSVEFCHNGCPQIAHQRALNTLKAAPGSPESASDLVFLFVAGAGFGPATWTQSAMASAFATACSFLFNFALTCGNARPAATAMRAHLIRPGATRSFVTSFSGHETRRGSNLMRVLRHSHASLIGDHPSSLHLGRVEVGNWTQSVAPGLPGAVAAAAGVPLRWQPCRLIADVMRCAGPQTLTGSAPPSWRRRRAGGLEVGLPVCVAGGLGTGCLGRRSARGPAGPTWPSSGRGRNLNGARRRRRPRLRPGLWWAPSSLTRPVMRSSRVR